MSHFPGFNLISMSQKFKSTYLKILQLNLYTFEFVHPKDILYL
jgi:hypothetical protein